MDMRFMHKCGTCKTKDNVSEGVVIDHVCVMASCESSAIWSSRKCGGRGLIADNMIESEVSDMRHQNLKSREKTYPR